MRTCRVAQAQRRLALRRTGRGSRRRDAAAGYRLRIAGQDRDVDRRLPVRGALHCRAARLLPQGSSSAAQGGARGAARRAPGRRCRVARATALLARRCSASTSSPAGAGPRGAARPTAAAWCAGHGKQLFQRGGTFHQCCRIV